MPDLNWSQVRETVLMMELAAGQVEAAMRESNSSVELLTESFIALGDMLQTIETAVGKLPNTAGNKPVKAQLTETTQAVSDKLHHAILNFQFYDKLQQRLAHVCHSLEGLADLIADPARLYHPKEWAALQEMVRSKYTMVEECAMFDAVMSGMPVEQALEQYMETRMKEVEESGGAVELF
jgi:hypothetical protein